MNDSGNNQHARQGSTGRRGVGVLLVALVLLCLPLRILAQTPDLQYVGLPATPLIGEVICPEVSFQNVSPAIGYGPYFVATTPPLVEIVSNVTYLGLSVPVEELGTIPDNGQIEDPISGQLVPGEPGGFGFLVRIPVGSVSQGQFPLVVDACVAVNVGATINEPLFVNFLPGFEFGNTPTGENGPITGSQIDSETITPQLARVDKSSTVIEGERPTGPSHAYDYIYEVDISEGERVLNFTLEDVLPGELQWTGAPIGIVAPQGVLCRDLSVLDDTIPGGTLEVNCASLGGTEAADDLRVTLPVYITDVLNQGVGAPDRLSIDNTVNIGYGFGGENFVNQDTETVVAVHVEAWKVASPEFVVPGDTATFTVNFSVTDYSEDEGLVTLVLDDTLGDGLAYNNDSQVSLNGGAPTPITATVVDDSPGPGQTSLTWDIAAAVGPIDVSDRGQLTYTAEVLQTFANGDPVVAGDPLGNDILLSFEHTEGAEDDNGSGSGVTIELTASDKRIVDPNPVPDRFEPGEEVTFRLQMDIPSGDVYNVVFEDFLPLPVIFVDDIDLATDIVVPGPPFLQITPVVTADSAANALRFEWGDISSDGPVQIAVDVTATITNQPFADGLFLTNLLATSAENSNGQQDIEAHAVGIEVGAPELVITKGVLSVDNPKATIEPAPPANPAQELVDSDAMGLDAADLVTFVITLENIGSKPAYNVTVTDPTIAGLACESLQLGDVRNGDGLTVPFDGDNLQAGIVVPGPVQGNDTVPPGGGAPFSSDTLLITQRCLTTIDVIPTQTLTNEASATYTSTPAEEEFFPPISDTATLTMAGVRVEKRLSSITPGYSPVDRSVHIGEVLTYEIDLIVPEGTLPAATLVDELDRGLAFVNLNGITATAGLSTSMGSFDPGVVNNAVITNQGGGTENLDRRLLIGPGEGDPGFGTIVNANTDNGVDDVITLTTLARVINWTGNFRGETRNNRATFGWTAPDGEVTAEDTAPNVTIVEPGIEVSKSFDPTSTDQGSPTTITIRARHTGNSDAEAFQLFLSDFIPAGLDVDPGSLTVTDCNLPPDSSDLNLVAFIAGWTSFPPGSDCSLEFTADVRFFETAGSTITNCVDGEWQSIAESDRPLPPAPNNPLTVPRTGDDGDTGGAANSYNDRACADLKVFDVDVIKSVQSSSQDHTGRVNGREQLAIGEEVSFLLTVTFPEAPAIELILTDELPYSSMVMELVSWEVLPLPPDTHLSNIDDPPGVSEEDRFLGDGIIDTLVLDFGDAITNSPADGVSDARDRLQVRVTARVKDLPENVNLDRDDNVARIQFGQGLAGSDQVEVQAVEPFLDLLKRADTSSVEAGDTVTYRLELNHRVDSRADAFDVELEDLLPDELTLIETSVGAPDCPVPPDTGPTGVGNLVTASWSAFPRGSRCTIEFQATVSVEAIAGSTIINTGALRWQTLDDTVSSDDERAYDETASWSVTVGDPGIRKTLTDTNIPETPGLAVTIGEEVTFEVVTFFPDGTTLDVVVRDQLPFVDARLRLLESRILSVGEDITIGTGLGVGDAGDDCLATTCQTGGNGYDDLAQWDLGEVINDPLILDDLFGERGQVVYEVRAIVVDDPANQGRPQGADFYVNEATLTALNEFRREQAEFGLVEPRLELTHEDATGQDEVVVDAGDEVEVVLTIEHQASSSAPAFDVSVTYTLDDSVSLPPGFSADSDCSMVTTDTSVDGVVVFRFPILTLDEGSCTLSFPVVMDDLLVIPGRYTDESLLNWESAPDSDESRTGTDTGDLVYVAGVETALRKTLISTSTPYTRSEQLDPSILDVTIGERVSYRITATLDEGTIEDVEIFDALPNGAGAGIVEILGGSVVRVGNNITTEFDGFPAIDTTNNDITFVFGEVQNTADGVSNRADQIVVEVSVRVLDDPANPPAPPELVNAAELRFDGGSVQASASADVVEPGIDISKTFGAVNGSRVPIELVISNPGNGPLFSVVVTDEFPELAPANWVPESMEPILVPDGWVLDDESANDVTTVTFQVDGDSTSPLPRQVIQPGASLTVSFSMELQAPPEETSILNVANAVGYSLPGGQDEAREVTADDDDVLNLPALDVTKAWSAPSGTFAAPGELITYLISIINDGDAPATNVVLVDEPDILGTFQSGSVVASAGGVVVLGNGPDDTTIEVNFPTVDAQSTATVTYTVLVPTPYPAATEQEFENQAEVTSTELPLVRSDDPATTDVDDDPTIVPIVADPVMEIEKDDLADVAGAGSTVFYFIDYANTGNQDATGVVITETVPDTNVGSGEVSFDAAGSTAGWSCADGSPPGTTCTFVVGDLGGGDGGQLTFAVTLADPLEEGVTDIENTVSITDDGLNTDPDNCDPDCERTDSATDDTPILAAPVLTVAKDDNIDAAVPGQVVVYDVVYSNIGDQDATGVVLSETVGDWVVFDAAASDPDWTCIDGAGPGSVCDIAVGELAAGDNGQAAFAVRVVSPLPAGVELTVNEVSITDDGTNSENGEPVVDLGSHATPLIAQPDMVIDKDDGGIIGQPGLIFPYTLTYTNAGNQDATGVVLTETVPVGATYAAVASLPQVWDCPDGSPANTVCQLAVGDFPVGAVAEARFGIQVDDPVPPGQAEVVNTARVDDDGANGVDPTPDNNEDTIETLVTLFPPAGRKQARDLGSGRVRWTMTWFNNENTRDLPVIILDPLPERTRYVQDSLRCTVDGTSLCQSATFNAAENRVEVEALIGPDFGFPDVTPNFILQNEIQVIFETVSTSSNVALTNRGEACWDENNTGSALDDLAQGQRCIPVTAGLSISVPIPGLTDLGRWLLVLLFLATGVLAWRRLRTVA